MSNLIDIAASGVRGYRAALGAVGENVAGAATPGYARRAVALEGADPGLPGPLERAPVSGFGVDVTGLRRLHDRFLAEGVRVAAADGARLDGLGGWLVEVEAALAAGGASAGRGITAFYAAAGGLAAEPASPVARAEFLTAADAVAGRFRETAATLADAADGAARALGTNVKQADGLARQIAGLNARLRRAEPGGAAAAGLADARDRLLGDLSKLAGISVEERARGLVTVRLGGARGPVLVDGDVAHALETDGRRVLIGRDRADVTGSVDAGAIGGLVAAVGAVADARLILDGVADSFAAAANTAHATGVDRLGAPGGALFLTRIVSADASLANTGNARPAVALAAGATPSAGGYRLAYDGALWTLARADGTASAVGAPPLALDGLAVAVEGDAVAGDLFTLTERSGARALSLAFDDPARVAAADAFLAGAALANAGGGRARVATDGSASAWPPAARYEIRFIDAATYNVVDPATGLEIVAPATYTPGAPIAGSGFSLTISGAPVALDRFTVAPTGPASGDAGAVQRLIATRGAGGGAATFEDRFDRASDRVSSRVADVRASALTAATTLDDAVAARDAVSGVSLDTEAADLLRYQQAYGASARVIQAAREIFDQLMGI